MRGMSSQLGVDAVIREVQGFALSAFRNHVINGLCRRATDAQIWSSLMPLLVG